MSSLVRWSAYCVVSGRRPDRTSTRRPSSRSATTRTAPTRTSSTRTGLCDEYFELTGTGSSAPRHSPHLDDRSWNGWHRPEFDNLLLETVVATYPQHEHEMFLAHFRGLISLWVHDTEQRLASQS